MRLRATLSMLLSVCSCFWVDDQADSSCGDGVVEGDEACEPKKAGVSDGWCNARCELARCGDGIIEAELSETCDDGNAIDADGCSGCVLDSCGDGIVQRGAGESCDEGSRNGSPRSRCGADCREALCGDGVVEEGESCDEGLWNGDDAACTLGCALATCGDGLVGPGETCDGSPGCPENCVDECGVASIASGWFMSYAVLGDGSVVGWGHNPRGELPGVAKTDAAAPTVLDLPRMRQVVGGLYFAGGIAPDGGLWTWGSNRFGQLARGPRSIEVQLPERIPDRTFRSLFARHSTLFAIDSDGVLHGAGLVGASLLFDAPLTAEEQLSDACPRDTHMFGGACTGRLLPLGDPSRRWRTIDPALHHVTGILEDGTLLGWGSGIYGQLGAFPKDLAACEDGLGPGAVFTHPQIMSEEARLVAAGNYGTLFALRDGSVHFTGSSCQGEGGEPELPPAPAPVTASWIGDGRPVSGIALGSNGNGFVTDESGTSFAFGNNEFAVAGRPMSESNLGPMALDLPAPVRQVAVGYRHATLLLTDGTVWAMGANQHGQLGEVPATKVFRERPQRVLLPCPARP